jgi:hypothetical protein
MQHCPDPNLERGESVGLQNTGAEPQGNGTQPKKKHGVRNVVLGVVGLIALIAIISSVTNPSSAEKGYEAGSSATTPPYTPAPLPTSPPTPTTPAYSSTKTDTYTYSPPPVSTPAPAPSVEGTASQQMALRAAQQYLSFEPFSYKGLIAQLDSPYGGRFSVADATWAADHVDADWNAEAVKAARQYLQTQPFSHAALVAQLDSPYGGKFTKAQAEYGATQAGD